jgi:hypothetical protein
MRLMPKHIPVGVAASLRSTGITRDSTSKNFAYKEPKVVTMFCFAPLNATNGIVSVIYYVLHYMYHGRCNSLEYLQTADYNYVEFKGLPKGKLYWLKILTTYRKLSLSH